MSAHRGYHRVVIKEQDYRTVLGLKIMVGSKRKKCSPLNTLCAVIVVPVMIWRLTSQWQLFWSSVRI